MWKSIIPLSILIVSIKPEHTSTIKFLISDWTFARNNQQKIINLSLKYQPCDKKIYKYPDKKIKTPCILTIENDDRYWVDQNGDSFDTNLQTRSDHHSSILNFLEKFNSLTDFCNAHSLQLSCTYLDPCSRYQCPEEMPVCKSTGSFLPPTFICRNETKFVQPFEALIESGQFSSDGTFDRSAFSKLYSPDNFLWLMTLLFLMVFLGGTVYFYLHSQRQVKIFIARELQRKPMENLPRQISLEELLVRNSLNVSKTPSQQEPQTKDAKDKDKLKSKKLEKEAEKQAKEKEKGNKDAQNEKKSPAPTKKFSITSFAEKFSLSQTSFSTSNKKFASSLSSLTNKTKSACQQPRSHTNTKLSSDLGQILNVAQIVEDQLSITPLVSGNFKYSGGQNVRNICLERARNSRSHTVSTGCLEEIVQNLKQHRLNLTKNQAQADLATATDAKNGASPLSIEPTELTGSQNLHANIKSRNYFATSMPPRNSMVRKADLTTIEEDGTYHGSTSKEWGRDRCNSHA